jgi:hypothetical protein
MMDSHISIPRTMCLDQARAQPVGSKCLSQFLTSDRSHELEDSDLQYMPIISVRGRKNAIRIAASAHISRPKISQSTRVLDSVRRNRRKKCGLYAQQDGPQQGAAVALGLTA